MKLFSLETCFYKAHSLYEKGHRRRASLLSFWYNTLHACDIPCSVSIGKGVKFAHRGLGVVINKGTTIGENCMIFLGVTIGGRGGTHKNDQPVIGNDCFIGCHATIIGRVVIGDKVTVGANSVVLNDIPSGETAAGVPARIISKPVGPETKF